LAGNKTKKIMFHLLFVRPDFRSQSIGRFPVPEWPGPAAYSRLQISFSGKTLALALYRRNRCSQAGRVRKALARQALERAGVRLYFTKGPLSNHARRATPGSTGRTYWRLLTVEAENPRRHSCR
jgi:GNAT superfamily N-acetyltransferase